jgi:hypothetical protein
MKKILILLIIFFGLISTYQLSAYSCNPCGSTWYSDNTTANFQGCTITIYYDYQQCNGECFFRITGILFPPGCSLPQDLAPVFEIAGAAIIQDAGICMPVGQNECVEILKIFDSACWEWSVPGPSGSQLLPCNTYSCCEEHWMWCKVYGVLQTPYRTYFGANTPCVNPPDGCMVICPQ